jgi:hypothetical protein
VKKENLRNSDLLLKRPSLQRNALIGMLAKAGKRSSVQSRGASKAGRIWQPLAGAGRVGKRRCRAALWLTAAWWLACKLVVRHARCKEEGGGR